MNPGDAGQWLDNESAAVSKHGQFCLLNIPDVLPKRVDGPFYHRFKVQTSTQASKAPGLDFQKGQAESKVCASN